MPTRTCLGISLWWWNRKHTHSRRSWRCRSFASLSLQLPRSMRTPQRCGNPCSCWRKQGSFLTRSCRNRDDSTLSGEPQWSQSGHEGFLGCTIGRTSSQAACSNMWNASYIDYHHTSLRCDWTCCDSENTEVEKNEFGIVHLLFLYKTAKIQN